jgi:hypothetical protein
MLLEAVLCYRYPLHTHFRGATIDIVGQTHRLHLLAH